MELIDIQSKIGTPINKCPICRHKNITYSMFCESCLFSWEGYYNQELKKEYGDKL